MKNFFILLVVILAGCIGQPAQKGGKASALGANIEQPENPSQPSSQDVEETTDLALPAGSAITKTAWTVEDGKTNTEQTVTTLPTDTKQTTRRHAAQTVGASQADTSRNLAVAHQAMRPVLYLGGGMLIVAAIFAWFGWWTKAAIVGGIGVLIVILAAVIPGHEVAFMVGGASLAVVTCLLVLYVYYKGHHDANAAKAAS